MTFAWRSSAIAFVVQAELALRISSLCWPSIGGARRTEQAVSENLNGMPSILQRADGRMLDRLDHVARGGVRIVERVRRPN